MTFINAIPMCSVHRRLRPKALYYVTVMHHPATQLIAGATAQATPIPNAITTIIPAHTPDVDSDPTLLTHSWSTARADVLVLL